MSCDLVTYVNFYALAVVIIAFAGAALAAYYLFRRYCGGTSNEPTWDKHILYKLNQP